MFVNGPMLVSWDFWGLLTPWAPTSTPGTSADFFVRRLYSSRNSFVLPKEGRAWPAELFPGRRAEGTPGRGGQVQRLCKIPNSCDGYSLGRADKLRGRSGAGACVCWMGLHVQSHISEAPSFAGFKLQFDWMDLMILLQPAFWITLLQLKSPPTWALGNPSTAPVGLGNRLEEWNTRVQIHLHLPKQWT